MLPAPLIITARHPREGGANNLSIKQRRELLSRILSRARYVDVELRSAQIQDRCLRSRAGKTVRRRSFRFITSVPHQVAQLACQGARGEIMRRRYFQGCHAHRHTGPALHDCSISLQKNIDLAVSAMGIGKLGAISRLTDRRAVLS